MSGNLTGAASRTTSPEFDRRFEHRLQALAALVILCVCVAAWLDYAHQSTDDRKSVSTSLGIVADFKAEYIANWMQERRGGADIARSSLVVRNVLANPTSTEARQTATQGIEAFRHIYGYAAVVVADSAGKVQLTVPDSSRLGLPASSITEQVQTGLHSRTVLVSGFSRAQSGEPAYLWLSCPVFTSTDTEHPPAGVVLVVVDPSTFLYPTLERWPTPSRTAESLLVSLQNGQIIYLNRSTYRTDGPAAGVSPGSEPTLASLVVQRSEGVFGATDIRGIPVYAALRKVQGTPWFVLAKIDQSEALAPLRREGWTIATIAGLLILAVALAVVLFWRQQRLARLRKELGEQRRVSEVLQASEKRLRTLFDQAPLAISISRATTIIYVNQKFLRMYGFGNADELYGKSIAEQWPPDWQELILDRAARRARGESVPTEYEGIGRRKDGSHLPVSVAVASIELADGPASLAFLTDITERKKAEQELRERDERFQALFNHQVAGMVIISPEQHFLEANDTWCSLSGYSRQELPDLTWSLLTHPEDLVADKEQFRRLLSGEIDRYEIEKRFVKRDGTFLYAAVSTCCVRRVDGTPEYILGLVADISQRKQAEQALSESEQKFRAIFEHSGTGMALLDLHGHPVVCNPTILEMLGYSEDELRQMTYPEFTHPDDVHQDMALAEELSKGHRQKYQIEKRYITKDKRIVWGLLTVGLVRDKQGEPKYAVGSIQDITERKLAEDHVRKLNRVYAVLSSINSLIVRERSLPVIFETACAIAVEMGNFQMVWIGTLDNNDQTIKPVASAGAVDGYLDLMNINFSDSARGAGPTARAVSSGKSQVSNDIAQDPSMRPWRQAALDRGYRSVASFPLKVADKAVGNLTLYAGETGFFDVDELRLLEKLAEDISLAMEVNQHDAERRRAEERLRSSEERFRLLIENASDIITVADREGILQFVSPSAKRVLGFDPDELLYRNVFDWIDPDDVPAVTAALNRLETDPASAAGVEYHFRHRDGSWRILQSISRSIPDVGSNGFVVVNSRDVTESRELEKQFRHAQKMEAIGQLAGGVAHDVNNVIAATTMQSELMLMLEDLPERVREGLVQIVTYSERAANLTQQLLTFSRKQIMRPRDLDLNDVVTNLSKMLQHLIGEKFDLRLNLHLKALLIHADPGMLEQVLMNLVVNARDAMPNGGELLIETGEGMLTGAEATTIPGAHPGPYVCLRVTDTGCGISPESLSHVFEPFFTTKERGKGTGLGLATVFGIVQQHGGTISVESEVARGTSFQILLPAVEPKAKPAELNTRMSALRKGNETILLVEDESPVRQLTRSILELAGYRVFEAADGVEAKRVWDQKACEIQLLLTDVVMPAGISGWELANTLRQRTPSLKIVFVSGYSPEEGQPDDALQDGRRFLQKPFSPHQILEAVRECLDS